MVLVRRGGRSTTILRGLKKTLVPMSGRSLTPTLLFVGMLSFGVVNGQTADRLKLKVRMSTDSQAEDKRQPRSFFRVSESNVMVMRVRDEGPGVQPFERMSPRFELYDRNKLGVVRQQEPVLKVPSGMIFLEDLVLLGGKPIMIGARRDTIKGIVELHWQHLDPNLTKYHPPFEPLTTFDAMVKGTGAVIPEGSAFRDPFFTTLSPDTNLMLVHSPMVVGTDGKTRHLMVVVDKGMDVKWKRAMDVPNNYRFESVQLDNLGNAYFVSRAPTKVTDKKDTTATSLQITMINGNEMTPCVNGLPQERHIKTLRFRPLLDGRIAVGGVHGGLDGRGEPTLGNFISFIVPGEAKLELLSTLKIDFDPKDAYLATDIRIMNLLPREKGGFFIVNEYHLRTDQPHTKLALSDLRWMHGPIMAIRTNAAGKEEWNSVFRRLHISWDPRVGEVFSLVFDDQLILFLLDSEELAARRKKDDKEQSHLDMKRSYSIYALFDDSGEAKAKAVLRSSGANDYIQGTELFKVGKSEYYVLGASKLGGSKLLPVKIELGE